MPFISQFRDLGDFSKMSRICDYLVTVAYSYTVLLVQPVQRQIKGAKIIQWI